MARPILQNPVLLEIFGNHATIQAPWDPLIGP